MGDQRPDDGMPDEQEMKMQEDPDLVFAIDMGLGARKKVFVTGQPEDFTVSFYDIDRDAWISFPKCDWERIVERVKAQF